MKDVWLQDLYDEKRRIAVKVELTQAERERLDELNAQIAELTDEFIIDYDLGPYCRGCGADLSRTGHTSNCENRDVID
jgi:hypothetical protein